MRVENQALPSTVSISKDSDCKHVDLLTLLGRYLHSNVVPFLQYDLAVCSHAQFVNNLCIDLLYTNNSYVCTVICKVEITTEIDIVV